MYITNYRGTRSPKTTSYDIHHHSPPSYYVFLVNCATEVDTP